MPGFVHILRHVVILALFVKVFTTSAIAQETINNASAGGRVTDSSGGVVPGAMVSLHQTETNFSISTTTDQEGRFKFPYLKPGKYDLRIHAAGFTDATKSAVLTVGSAFNWNVSLALESLLSDVNVVSSVEEIETARTQIAGTVLQSEIEDLPVPGRSYLEAAIL